LMGYFRRAIIFNKRFIDIFNQHKTTSAVLDSAPRGIVTVGQNGQVTYSNAEAQRIFSQADGVNLNNNKINFRDEKLREKYAYFIEIAGQETETPGKPERMSAVIKRPSTDTPYQLMAYTLPVDRRKALLSEDEAHAVLIIQDATKNLQLRADLLQTFYNLSMAEANLAVTLYKGNTLPEAADKLHVSINTARSQLRGIFKKVGVNSQAMLLQALASGAKDVTRNTYKSSIN
jgi:DNA-binding CsgD family transcriptional regulator